MGTKTLLTIAQFDQIPEKEGILYELDEGEVVTMTEPMPRHNIVRDNIARFIGNFVQERKVGRIFVETGYQLASDTVRIPDVSFVPADRLRGIGLDRRIEGAPALAIEVVSPTDTAQDLRRKVAQYLDSGAKAVWVFYPKSREVEVFHADGTSFIRREHESLEEPELLPDFALDLKAVFE